MLFVEGRALDQEPVYVVTHLRSMFQFVDQFVFDFVHQLDLVECFDLLLVGQHGNGEHVEEFLGVEERGNVLGFHLAEVGQGVAHEVDAGCEVFGPLEQVFVGVLLTPAFRHDVMHERLFHVIHVEIGVAVLARDYIGDVGFD